MSEKTKTRKNRWMVCEVDVLHIQKFYGKPSTKQDGYISELDFCEKYNIPK
jgi:hypothetical protein